MGLFDNPAELERKAKLKAMEDKRLAFTQALLREGFAPDKMLFAQTERGGFVSLCREKGQYVVIEGPDFGSEDDFRMHRMDALNVREEQVNVPSEGMGGIFGLGRKPQRGVEYVIALPDGGEARMAFVGGRNGWMERKLEKNPLLNPKRRKGDANLCWDMSPIDAANVQKVLDVVKGYFE